MPGLPSCVRCGSSLTLASSNIDVMPPRAGRLSKVLRAGRQTKRGLKQSAEKIGAGVRDGLNSFNIEVAIEIPRHTACIAGWPQFLTGRPILGWIFLLGFIGCLLPAIIFLGSDWSTWLLGAAIAFHLSSIVDVVMRSTKRGEPMYQEALPLIAAACGYGYAPVLLFLFIFCWPVRVEFPVAGFRAGDVVLTCRALGADVGDAVRYQPRTDAYYIDIRGTWVERILARAGSQVA